MNSRLIPSIDTGVQETYSIGAEAAARTGVLVSPEAIESVRRNKIALKGRRVGLLLLLCMLTWICFRCRRTHGFQDHFFASISSPHTAHYPLLQQLRLVADFAPSILPCERNSVCSPMFALLSHCLVSRQVEIGPSIVS